ncbi:MAG: UbiA family prenyltransferase [Trueperaceae bacterium]|nr:MAG: UbiA family prenyltransferase [Trueperaceae bacterium]
MQGTVIGSHIQEHRPSAEGVPPDPTPLFVDLDGTLLKSDLLIESILQLIRHDPWNLFRVVPWVLGGKAHFKDQVARRAEVDAGSLPYQAEFLKYLRSEAAGGRRLVLATAANSKPAQVVADHLGIFESVLASDATTNLVGRRKREAVTDASNGRAFDYAGNSVADLEIWPQARRSVLVNPDRGVESAAQKVASVEQVFDDRSMGVLPYLKAMRVHQWLKNLLVLVPLLTAHAWFDVASVFEALAAFFAFCFCASSAYLVNDLLDLAADRRHPRKRERPLAAGDVSLVRSFALALVLFAAGLALAAALDLTFLLLVSVYLCLTTLYSFYLKKIVLLDVLVLAGLYTLRVAAGAAAIGVLVSFWLLAFCLFLFSSLALLKRCSELDSAVTRGTTVLQGRGYQVGDAAILRTMGLTSGLMVVLVLALFIDTPEVAVNYARPQLLWLICPLMLYWVGYLWLKNERHEMVDDPLIFSLSDPVTRTLVALMAILFLAAV